jgi:hypothetical protein
MVILVSVITVLPCAAADITTDDLHIHGFVSQGFLYTTKDMPFLAKDSGDGTFDFNEMAVNFSANPMDNLNLGMQLYAFDLGDVGNDSVEVDWAFGDYSLRDYLGVRVGIMKIPFGLYNEVRKVDMVRTSVLLPTSVYPEWFRETFARMKGVGLYGTLPGDISYQAMYGDVNIKGDGGLAEGMSILMSSLGMEVNNVDTNFAYAGKLQWESPFGLKLAASYYALDGLQMYMDRNIDLPAMVTGGLAGLTSPMKGNIEFNEPVESFVLSAEYMTDRLTLASEYTETELDFTIDIITTLDPAIVAAMQIPPRVSIKTTFQGYYASIAYRILDRLELGTYYSELYYDKSDHNGREYEKTYNKPDYNAWLKDICLSARYDFSPSWCGKLEAHLMDGSFFSMSSKRKDWALYAAKVTYSF